MDLVENNVKYTVEFTQVDKEDEVKCYSVSGLDSTGIYCECGNIDYTPKDFLNKNVKVKDSLIYVRIEKAKVIGNTAFIKIYTSEGIGKSVVFNISKKEKSRDVGGSYLNLSYKYEGDDIYIISSVTSGVSSSYGNVCDFWVEDNEHVKFKASQNESITYDEASSTFSYTNIYLFKANGNKNVSNFNIRFSTEREDHKIINSGITVPFVND